MVKKNSSIVVVKWFTWKHESKSSLKHLLELSVRMVLVFRAEGPVSTTCVMMHLEII